MWRIVFCICVIALEGGAVAAQTADVSPYKVTTTAKVGGGGGFDYVFADADQRRLYVPRSGTDPAPRISVFNLDTLTPVGEIADVNARGAAVDLKSHHGFGSSKPVVMWDSKTLKNIMARLRSS
jgi:hypothetical protein